MSWLEKNGRNDQEIVLHRFTLICGLIFLHESFLGLGKLHIIMLIKYK